jgi:transcriptional regulator with XRE-family HTH domain
MNNLNNPQRPFRVLIRDRRQELHLGQAQVAEALRLVPESVGQWERGNRRIELDKVPRLARVLKLDPKDLCQTAIYEFHPLVYMTVFGSEPPPQPAEVAA